MLYAFLPEHPMGTLSARKSKEKLPPLLGCIAVRPELMLSAMPSVPFMLYRVGICNVKECLHQMTPGIRC